jgi:hypothetical protein
MIMTFSVAMCDLDLDVQLIMIGGFFLDTSEADLGRLYLLFT